MGTQPVFTPAVFCITLSDIDATGRKFSIVSTENCADGTKSPGAFRTLEGLLFMAELEA